MMVRVIKIMGAESEKREADEKEKMAKAVRELSEHLVECGDKTGLTLLKNVVVTTNTVLRKIREAL